MIDEFLRDPFWIEVENWPLSWEIGGTWLFPFIESIHVITIAMVVGSILFVDLRLLGLAALRYPIRALARELIPWTWGAFVIATITGLGMFITRAASHVLNPAFQWKMILLALAGANMAWFHFRIYHHLDFGEHGDHRDDAGASRLQLKIIGSLSLFLWAGVVLAGRWVGHIV